MATNDLDFSSTSRIQSNEIGQEPEVLIGLFKDTVANKMEKYEA